MSTVEMDLELIRADLARTILNADADFLTKVSRYVKRIAKQNPDKYYDSAQFHEDINEAEEDILNGNYTSVKDSSDLDNLFS